MPDSKTKIRPQQSCLKCRERKVKCDRSIPCHACIIRGLDAECTYTATPEDRAQISQADIIERLRREVAQLRGRLTQREREPARQSPKSWRQHPYAGRRSEREGSWSASSPSSSTTTMTHSQNVTSPDSTGSENGGSGSSSVSASASASASVSASAGPYPMIGVESEVSDVDFGQTIPSMHSYGGLPFAGDLTSTMQGPVHGLHPMPALSSVYDPEKPHYPHAYSSIPTPYDEMPNKNQWTDAYGMGSHQLPIQPYASAPVYSSIDPFANVNAHANANAIINAHTNTNTYADAPLSAGDTSSRASSNSVSPRIMNAIPSSWRGEGKKAVLEALLETIGSCDEHQVSQVIQVVRSSPTPEEAVSGICQVLGLGNGW